MKARIIFLVLLLGSIQINAQEGHKLNTGIDMSFGLHYFNSEKNNPVVAGFSVGYEYDFVFFFGIEAGFRFGGFNQKVNYPIRIWVLTNWMILIKMFIQRIFTGGAHIGHRI